MSMLPTFKSDEYKDGRTKQGFKDSCDINKILRKWQKTGTITHLAKYQGQYGDFSDIDDLLTAQERLARGQAIFDELPGEVKREFNQNVGDFYKFVNDPANADKLADVLPSLAASGAQMPDIRKKVAQATGGASLDDQEPPATPNSAPVGAQ